MRAIRPLRGVKVALAAAVGGALLVPAGLMAADEPQPTSTASAPALTAALAIRTAEPTAGVPVAVDASESTGAIAGYRWDLDGDGEFEADGGSSPAASVTLTAGTHRVAVLVLDDAGRTAEASAAIDVAPAPAPAPDAAPSAAAAGPAPPAGPRATDRNGHPPARTRPPAREPRPKRAVAAASQSVAIENFLYSPATITVDVGDTVTWTNRDEAPHTSTARSFNTGNLEQGESGSHTFTAAGRFPYICALHPAMKGTVVVAGAGGGTAGGGDDGGAASGSASGSPDSGVSPDAAGTAAPGGSLPQTGFQLLGVVLVGAALLASGSALRVIAR